jgi:hypothetical protein
MQMEEMMNSRLKIYKKIYKLNNYAYHFLYSTFLYVLLAFFLIFKVSLANEHRLNIHVKLMPKTHEEIHKHKKKPETRYKRLKTHRKKQKKHKKINKHQEKQRIITKKSSINNSKSSNVFSATFYKLGFLSDNYISYGINPSYTFYIPVLAGYKGGSIKLHIGLPNNLRKDSYVRIVVDGSVYKNYQAGSIPSFINIDLPKSPKSKFIKIDVEGYLRATHNVCEDISSRATYLEIYKDSEVSINIDEKPLSIHNLFNLYKAHFLIQDDPEIFSMAYYLSKYSKTNFYSVSLLEPNNNFNNAYYIYKSNNNNTYILGNVFYVSNKFLDALPYYPIALADSGTKIYNIEQRSQELTNKVSFKQLGIDNINLNGELNLSQNILLDTSKLGGLPKHLKLYLHIVHTPILKSQNPSLRVYVNDALINAFSAESSNNRMFNIEIPSRDLKYGANSIKVSLVLSVASQNCYGSIPKTAMSILDDSYFEWDSLDNKPKKINDFISNLNGNVLVLLEDKNFDAYAVKFLNDLGKYDKNITNIKVVPWNGKANINTKGFNFVIVFSDPGSLSALSHIPIKLNAGDFDVVNPLTGKTLFKASYFDGFGVVEIAKFNDKPALVFSFYKDEAAISYFNSLDFKDYYKMIGNASVVYKDNYTSYNVGNALRVHYAKLQGIAYYWERFKLFFVIVLGALAIYFLFYVYKKLTKPPEV